MKKTKDAPTTPKLRLTKEQLEAIKGGFGSTRPNETPNRVDYTIPPII